MKFYFLRGITTLDQALAQIQAGMDNLNLKDNFQGFEWSGTIAPSSEVLIRNKMRRSEIPTSFIITMAEGCNSVVKGSTEWTNDTLSLANFDAALDAKVSIFFYR